MIEYQFALPNKSIKAYALTTFIMLSINFLGFGFIFLNSKAVNAFFSIICMIAAAIPWLYFILQRKNMPYKILLFSFIIGSMGWCYFGNLWVGLLLLVFTFVGYFINKDAFIIINDDGIIYPWPTKRLYTWAEVSHVIYKDDTLTIDLKNNTLHQVVLNNAFTNYTTITAFNKFCNNSIAG